MILNPPTVSVIMPIRNEAEFISESLGAVLAQDYPDELIEVLVADGMSTDATRSIVEDIAKQNKGVNIRIIDNPGGIVPTGFNRAFRASTGDIIIRVDGHTIVGEDYIAECVRSLQETDASNVGGAMTAVGSGYVAETIALATSTSFGVGGARFHYSQKDEWVDTVYLGAWRRETFNEIGLFDEEMVRNQDDEFNYRLRANGGKILLRSAIRSRYFNRNSLTRLWRQYFQYGYWKVRVMQKHHRQMQIRHFIPPLFVLAVVGSIIVSLLTRMYIASFVVLGSYLVAAFGASLKLGAHSGLRFVPLLPAVFAILHTSYGSGFLVGLFRFRRNWSSGGQ